MALNSLGLGLTFTAKDLASGTINQVGDSMKKTGKEAVSFKDRTEQIGGAMQKVGAVMLGVGVAGAAGLGMAVASARDFGSAIAQSATLVDEAKFSTDEMFGIATDLASQFGKMPVEEANAMYDAISSGADTAAKATDMMTAANKLAIGGATTVGTSVQALSVAVNAYASSNMTAAAAADTFFVAINAGVMNAEQLSASLGNVVPIAASLNVSLAETTGAMAAITKSGLNASEAANGLKAALSNVIKPTDDAVKEATRLGIKFDQASLRAKGFQGFIEEITHSSKFNNESMAKLFGSVEGVNAMLALTANNGATFSDVMGQMKTATGSTHRAFGTMSDTLKFSQDKFKALIEVGKIMVGDVLAPMATRVLDTASKWVAAFNRMSPATREMITKAAAAASAIAGIGGAATLLGGKILPVIGTIASFIGSTSLGGIASVALPVVGAIVAVTTVLAGLAHAVHANVGGLGDTVGGFFSGIKLSFQALVQLFTQGGFSGAVRDEFMKGENPFINFAIKVYVIVNRIKNFFSGLIDGFQAAIERAAPTFEHFSDALKRLGAAFGLMSVDVAGNKAAFDSAGEAGASFGDKIGQVVTVVVDVMTMGIDIVTGFVAAWKEVEPALAQVWASVQQLLAPFGSLIGLTGEATSSGHNMHSTFQQIGAFLGGTLAGAFRKASNFISDLAATFDTWVTGIKGAINIVSGIMTGDWSRVWLGFRQIVVSAINGVVDMFFAGISALADGMDSIASLFGADTGFGKEVRDMRDAIKNDIKGAIAGGDLTGAMAVATVTNPVPAQVASQGPPNMDPSGGGAGVYYGPGGPQSIDPAMISDAAASAAASAVSKSPPPAYSFNLVCDGEVLGRIASNNAPQSVDIPTPIAQ